MTRDELDYEELLRNYGNEYLQENNPDDCLYAMDEMDELFNESAYNAIQRAFTDTIIIHTARAMEASASRSILIVIGLVLTVMQI